eukprot:3126827-Prymnesium_polylepis.1
MWSGVAPLSIAWLIATPLLHSIAATSVWPSKHAMWSGVTPLAIAWLIGTSRPLQGAGRSACRYPPYGRCTQPSPNKA